MLREEITYIKESGGLVYYKVDSYIFKQYYHCDCLTVISTAWISKEYIYIYIWRVCNWLYTLLKEIMLCARRNDANHIGSWQSTWTDLIEHFLECEDERLSQWSLSHIFNVYLFLCSRLFEWLMTSHIHHCGMECIIFLLSMLEIPANRSKNIYKNVLSVDRTFYMQLV
jgi:hypothetical protein